MNKRIKLVIAGLVALSFGIVSVATVSSPALAKTKAAKVISHQKLAKTKFHPNGGSLYTSTKLTKKSPKTFKAVKTTFYATKSVKVKKANSKRATYYYVKNKKGNINGWIWKGYLNKTKNLAQRASDIRRFKATYKYVDNPKDDGYQLYRDSLSGMTLAHAYNDSIYVDKAGIPSILEATYSTSNAKTLRGCQATYKIFKGRFSAKINAKLAKQWKKVLKDSAAVKRQPDVGDVTDQMYDSTLKFTKTLGHAIHGLDK